jgi:hypothetical protein
LTFSISLSSQLSQAKPLYLQGAVQDFLQDKRGKRKRGSSLSSSSPTKSTTYPSFDIDWEAFKTWPQGLKEEERAMIDHFRRLKMTHIEQETKNLFIASTNDSTQIVYTAAKVQQLEAEVEESKRILKQRKQVAADFRGQIESLAEDLKLYEVLQADIKESEKLSNSIKEMEFELMKLEASRGPEDASGRESTASGNRAPRRGTVTREEALETLGRQVETMQSNEEEQERTLQLTDHAKKHLAEAMQALSRIEHEQRLAEKQAKQVETQARDRKIESQCRAHLATLAVLKGLLGISSIGAPTPTCLRCVYKVQDTRARQFCAEVAVLIHFTTPTGRIKSYELQSTAGQVLTDRLAPLQSPSRANLDRAVAANDASLLIQEILVCVESATSTKQGAL